MPLRHLFYSLLVSLFPVLISAQNFFPTDSAVWKEAQYRLRASGGSPRMGQVIMYGDTIVNGVPYKLLDVHPDGIQLIRLDSLEQKVFLSPQGQGIGALPLGDNLLYDFGVTVGDSIPIIEIATRDSLYWVVVKDSVQEFGGKMLRFIDVTRDYYGYVHTDRWVEGIGSLSGFLAPFDEPSGFFEYWFQLVCFQDLSDGFQYESDTLWYDYINCNASLSIPEKATLNISQFPNPFYSYIRVLNNSASTASFNLTTMSGVLVIENQILPYQDLRVTTEDLPSGFYIIHLRGKTGVSRKKIYKYK